MVGLDIGTTACKGFYVDTTGKPVGVRNHRGEVAFPSAVHISTNGDVLVGREAIEQGALDPARLVLWPKLELGTTRNLVKDGPTVTATDAVTELIKTLKAAFESTLGIVVKEAVFTCPANFRDDSKQALLEAAGRCGITVLRLLPEPTAASIAYAVDKGVEKARIAVSDWGGGTYDVSVVQRDGSDLTVQATAGVRRLGGNDLNKCLMDEVLSAFKERFGAVPTPEAEPLLYLDLEQKLEQAKISLNSRPQVPLVVGYKGDQLVVKLTQERFHAAIEPLVAKAIASMDEAMAAAGLGYKDIDRLILVGGTSNLKYIQDRLADHTRLLPKVDIDPQTAVASGAALAAVVELEKLGRQPRLNNQAIPSPEVFARDVTRYGVGCCVVDKSLNRRELRNAVIVPKQTAIPCRRVEGFYLEEDDQTAARIEILQGEPNALRDECLVIGELLLENLPPERTRTRRISVELEIDRNGMVTAVGTDAVSGTTRSVSVDYKKGVAPRETPPAFTSAA